MTASFIRSDDFAAFVTAMIEAGPVYGPVAKRSRFAFARLETPEELRLGYDVTILPPKKLFFPPAQDLLQFGGDGFRAPLAPTEKVLLGVHFYDVKAIDQTDLLFSERNYDINYMAHRETTTIVASNIQAVSNRAFFASVGADVQPTGHDAFLTVIVGGYALETRTERGEALLERGAFQAATDAQIQEAARLNAAALEQCPEKLEHGTEAIAEKVRAAFGDDELWAALATDCFSCGTCNTVCPTCYCFDVQDTWNVDLSGQRTRFWDGCLTEDFAKCSLGDGASENFREERAQRFRHRMMRKATYLNEKLGGPACVGCGRCSAACTADIADPVRIIDRIMAS
ncbi:MAG TPA: 4Fe-4S dicluster domain-containing protein [Thermoleophilia bacterium]|nr:4Fe-4S dicluster domain-containing protein [Thermoleophilia bacterium]